MSSQAAGVVPAESEYLTVPEIAKILRRDRKTVSRTFDYAKRFLDSDEIKQRVIETSEKTQPTSVTEGADSWLLGEQSEVKKSTRGYYKEVSEIFIQRYAIGRRMASELRQEDIDRWRVRVDEKQTGANEPPSTRPKNMVWDVPSQILDFAHVRKLLNEDLLLGVKPFKDSGHASDDSELSDETDDADMMPYNAERIEAIIRTAEGWERSVVTLYFFTGIRRGEALPLTWDRVYLDRDWPLINRSLRVPRHQYAEDKKQSTHDPVRSESSGGASQAAEGVQLRSRYVFLQRERRYAQCALGLMSALNHAHPMPTRPETGTKQPCKTMIQIEKNPIKLAGETVCCEPASVNLSTG